MISKCFFLVPPSLRYLVPAKVELAKLVFKVLPAFEMMVYFSICFIIWWALNLSSDTAIYHSKYRMNLILYHFIKKSTFLFHILKYYHTFGHVNVNQR